ncbi:MAG: DUF2442 domain-containing protein [Thermoguttaceae bacterium]
MLSTEISPEVVAVFPNRDFTLSLTFENGEQKLFDMNPYLEISPRFRELADWDYFSQVRCDIGTIVWPHGHDLCPDTLYLDSR